MRRCVFGKTLNAAKELTVKKDDWKIVVENYLAMVFALNQKGLKNV